MEGLLTHTYQVASHTTVNDPTFGDLLKLGIDLEDAHAGGDDDALLSSPVKVPAQIMVFKGVEGHVEHFQKVAPGRRRDARLGNWLVVVVGLMAVSAAGSAGSGIQNIWSLTQDQRFVPQSFQ